MATIPTLFFNKPKTVQTSGSTLTIGSYSLNTATSGFGGIDTGSIASSTFYYVYQVLSGSTLGLVASTSATSPSGFLSYSKMGAFYTDSSSIIFNTYNWGEQAQETLTVAVSSAGATTAGSQNVTWVSSTAQASTGNFNIVPLAGFISLLPRVVVTLSATLTGADVGSAGWFVPAASSASLLRIAMAHEGSDAQAAALDNFAFNVIVHKVGVDATQPDWT